MFFVSLPQKKIMSEVASPCIKICHRDSQDVCFGCRRTGEEIGKWSKFSDDEKREVIEKTFRRSNVPGEAPPGNYLR